MNVLEHNISTGMIIESTSDLKTHFKELQDNKSSLVHLENMIEMSNTVTAKIP